MVKVGQRTMTARALNDLLDHFSGRLRQQTMTARALNDLLDHLSGRLTLVDVGARGGAHGRWRPLDKVADIVCFEPDREECERLEATRPPNVRYLPVGLSDAAGERDLFITVDPSSSSNFEP